MYYKFYNYTKEHNLIDYIESKYKTNKNKEIKNISTTLISRHVINSCFSCIVHPLNITHKLSANIVNIYDR